jgi:hypothetical protein
MTDDEFEALHAEVRRRLHGARRVSRNSRNSMAPLAGCRDYDRPDPE